ncbi:MAG TPA: hypothetical protein VI306_00885 [Pyrinomonadaceae bacterium]
MNQILLGPLLGDNRRHLIERCAELVANNESHKFLYLAASYPLLEVVTEKILDGTTNRGIWGELPVFLFRGFVRRILSSAIDADGHNLSLRLPIDREELPLKRSLISQILARLKAAGKLNAIAPLAGREGCVNTFATLLGELQRAARTPTEVAAIIAARAEDLGHKTSDTISQIDFDKEVALIYETYSTLLDQHNFTENDADQLRALTVLRGNEGMRVPWLANVELLILDGFFDFTPVQGQIVRELLPRIPETIVSLNFDPENPEIFVPFGETVDQLRSITPFETHQSDERLETSGALSELRTKLFNPTLTGQPAGEPNEGEPENTQAEIRYFECGDRDSEMRAIAKEIKRLVLLENYDLGDIAVVVREREAYAKTISRVMYEESIPCKLELRVDVVDVPATRAGLKLFELLEQPTSGDVPAFRTAELADLIKSEYFRLTDDELSKLFAQFDSTYLHLLSDDDRPLTPEAAFKAKSRYRIGIWDADALENAFAYVGGDLPVNNWLARAQKLIKELPSATATKELLNIDPGAQDRDADIADQVENAETARLEEKVEKKRRPSRDIHPAALAWTALVIQRFAELIFAVPREGTPLELRVALMKLLEQFGFRDQITRPTRTTKNDDELPQVMLNFNALESTRRALVAAIKSIEMTMSDMLVESVPPRGSGWVADSPKATHPQPRGGTD